MHSRNGNKRDSRLVWATVLWLILNQSGFTTISNWDMTWIRTWWMIELSLIWLQTHHDSILITARMPSFLTQSRPKGMLLREENSSFCEIKFTTTWESATCATPSNTRIFAGHFKFGEFRAILRGVVVNIIHNLSQLVFLWLLNQHSLLKNA